MPAGSLLGQSLAAHVAQPARRRFRNSLTRAAQGADVRFSFDVVPRGLEPVRVRARVRPAQEGLAWVLREQHAAGAERELAETQLGQLVEGIRDAVLVVDAELCVRFANRTARVILGPHGLELGEPLPDPWPTSLRRLVADLLEYDGVSAEALIEADARTSYRVAAYQSDPGDRAVLLLSDVSEEERRERAEREFIVNAAHELQSPLTGISTAVEILLGGAHERKPTRLKFLQHIARENERLSRLLRSLLLLAEVQSGGGGVEPQPVDLRAALEELLAQTQADGVRIELLCPDDLVVVTHFGLLEHALTNLVSNAVRYGGGHVIVTARPRRGGGVVIEVVDHGPGLGADERAQAFDRFYRGRARDAQGFGLGLSIVREVARTLGGEVELLPNANGGLTARLTLEARA